MRNPTPEECEALAERWSEHFRWNGYTLEVRGFGTFIAYSPTYNRWNISGDLGTDRPSLIHLGLAALTWKCMEIEPRLSLIPIPAGRQWAIGRPYYAAGMICGYTYSYRADSSWACLLQMEE